VDSADPVSPNEEYAYTIFILNNGQSDAQNATVTDTFSDVVTVDSIDGCNNNPDPGPGEKTFICELGTIPANDEKLIAIKVTAPDTEGTVTNTARVSFSADVSVTSTDVISDTEETQVRRPTEADLAIDKTDSADPVWAGEPYAYTVTVTNYGPADAQGVKVFDSLPEGVTFVSTAGCDNNPDPDPDEPFTCELGTIPAEDNNNKSFTINVIAPCTETPTTVENVASVTSSTYDPPGGPGKPITRTDTLIKPWAVLDIAKTDSDDPVWTGQAYSYRVTVTNNGPCDAQNVTVTDALPDGVTDVSIDGCSNNPDPKSVPFICELGIIPAKDNNNKSFAINVTAPDTEGTVTNMVRVTSSTEDRDRSKPTASETTTVREPPCPPIDESKAPLNAVLWIAQIILAIVFLIAGVLKLFWQESRFRGLLELGALSTKRKRLIGVLEILAAGGLILPALTCKLHWLTPVAASGLAVLLIGDIFVRGKPQDSPERIKPEPEPPEPVPPERIKPEPEPPEPVPPERIKPEPPERIKPKPEPPKTGATKTSPTKTRRPKTSPTKTRPTKK
jgi:uncharacterized repeat protein (TIGR01451 family)